MVHRSDLREKFGRVFGAGGEVRGFRAPGRVELIGGDVDYNEGWVLALAIDWECVVAARPRSDRWLRMHSAEFAETVEVALGHSTTAGVATAGAEHHWSRYIEGVAWSLGEAGIEIAGADLYIESEIPVGAGLSSSAALEVAAGMALSRLSGTTPEMAALALACQRAENEYVGTRCGIMDQLTACLGRRDRALLIDCRTLEIEQEPLEGTRARLVVAETKKRHALATSEYNRRREECEEAARRAAEKRAGVQALRDASWEEIEQEAQQWPEAVRRRARHVTEEIRRVREAALALRSGDFEALGRLMNESHRSLAVDFEVSSPELDLMVELARGIDGLLGARMMGGGFGGATVNLVEAERAEKFAAELARQYEEQTGIRPEVMVCRAEEGAGELS